MVLGGMARTGPGLRPVLLMKLLADISSKEATLHEKHWKSKEIVKNVYFYVWGNGAVRKEEIISKLAKYILWSINPVRDIYFLLYQMSMLLLPTYSSLASDNPYFVLATLFEEQWKWACNGMMTWRLFLRRILLISNLLMRNTLKGL